MKTVNLALCLALVGVALVPTASACCIHTTRQLAWAEYVQVGDVTRCAVVSAPAPVQEDACLLAVEESTTFQLGIVDGSLAAVGFTWDACGSQGAGAGAGEIVVPPGCERVRVTLGQEATSGILRLVLF